MYGMVNKFISTTVVKRYGKQAWTEISQSLGDYEATFLEMQPYDDEITFGIVGATVTHLNIDASVFLQQMGEDWVEATAHGSYKSMYSLVSGGVFEFLSNLNNMHQVISAQLEELVPPSFLCQKNEDGSITINYYSSRQGLEPFVQGLLKGVCNHFDEPATITVENVKDDSTTFSTFRIDFA